jgi:hypothetical protein
MLRSVKDPLVQFGVQSSKNVVRGVKLMDRLVLRFSTPGIGGLVALSTYCRFFRQDTGADMMASQVFLLLSTLLMTYATINLETFRRP